MLDAKSRTKTVSIEDRWKGFSEKAGDYGGRLSELTIGLTAFGLLGFVFSYVLYPFVIFKTGAIRGGAIMTFLSFSVCLILLKFYDSSKRDWLGIEAVKRLKDYEGRKILGRLWSWFLKKGEPAIFLFLSIKVDPFVTTAYLRRGNYTGMSKRDWKIFMGSLIISNAYWTLACFMGITIFEWAWKVLIEG